MSRARAIPDDPEGYAVEPNTGIVHTRYASHAAGLPRTRTRAGVRALSHVLDVSPCDVCYPTSGLMAGAKPPVLPPPDPMYDVGSSLRELTEGNVEPVATEDIPVSGEVNAD